LWVFLAFGAFVYFAIAHTNVDAAKGKVKADLAANKQ